MFPRARAAIKYLVADGRYDYIETGSLMSIRKNVKDIVIPSEERHISMYPMDFEEFLWALGDDIMKHSEGNALDIEAIFDEIPAQLSKHEKKFKLKDFKSGARLRRYKQPFFWLDDAMIVNTCYNSTEPNIGLKMNMERKTLKCYMADTGLLISHAFDENGIVAEEIYRKLLFDKLSVNSGMLMENMVAQMLVAAGHKLYFFSKSSRTNAANRMEIDFLIAKKRITSKHNISPIEVKSGERYTLSSINKFRKKYAEAMDTAYVLHTKDYKEQDGVVYLPLYMTMFL